MINSLGLRDLDTYSPQVRAFMQDIERSFLQIAPPAEIIQLRDSVEGIGFCLETDEAPANQFECFSCGAFKEAYHASDSVVMKFCSTDNPTEKEKKLLDDALDAGLQDLFVPTFFHRLPSNLWVTLLDDSNSSRFTYNSKYHDWVRDNDVEDFELNYLEIQPLVVPATHIKCEWINWEEKRLSPAKRIPTSNRTWLQSIMDNYGEETLEKFADFCEDRQIWDLHNDNIGFLRTPEANLPIILDWMSN